MLATLLYVLVRGANQARLTYNKHKDKNKPSAFEFLVNPFLNTFESNIVTLLPGAIILEPHFDRVANFNIFAYQSERQLQDLEAIRHQCQAIILDSANVICLLIEQTIRLWSAIGLVFGLVLIGKGFVGVAGQGGPSHFRDVDFQSVHVLRMVLFPELIYLPHYYYFWPT